MSTQFLTSIRRLLVALTIIVICSVPAPAFCDPGATSYPLIHEKPNPSTLPVPGLPLALQVVLPKEAIGFALTMQAQVYRDGELWDLFVVDAEHDSLEQLIYSAVIPSPRKELRYTFTFYNRDGFLQKSPEYTVLRTCAPSLDLTSTSKVVVGDPQGIPTKEEMAALVEQSIGLEKDIHVYERAIDVANELKNFVEKK